MTKKRVRVEVTIDPEGHMEMHHWWTKGPDCPGPGVYVLVPVAEAEAWDKHEARIREQFAGIPYLSRVYEAMGQSADWLIHRLDTIRAGEEKQA